MKKNKGFSIIEFLFAIVIATLIVGIITIFAKNILSLNSSAQSSMTAMLESRKILSVMVAELRSTSPSALGSYPIESASTSTIIFFADLNSDNVSDRVRYFIDPVTKSVRRGVVLATGEPPSYNLGSETLSTLIMGLSNGTSTALFEYHNGNYAGTSSPLSIPVSIPAIRLIKINIKIERDPNRAPEIMTLSSQAELRNLKDNL